MLEITFTLENQNKVRYELYYFNYTGLQLQNSPHIFFWKMPVKKTPKKLFRLQIGLQNIR